jgi:hypothetical protein
MSVSAARRIFPGRRDIFVSQEPLHRAGKPVPLKSARRMFRVGEFMPINPKSITYLAEEFSPDMQTRTGQSRLNVGDHPHKAGVPVGALHSIEISVTDGVWR